MSPVPQAHFDNHPARIALSELPGTDIHVQAHAIAKLIRELPEDPGIHQTPRGIAVGSFALQPAQSGDLDFEVQNVSWEHLQKCFEEKVGVAGIADVQLTHAGADGIIDPERGDLGNAFVAVWITMEGGRHVNLSIPLRVNSETNRYDLNSVERVPELPFAEASTRRSFAHRAVGYDPLSGASGEIIDPLGGVQSLVSKQLRILSQESFSNDPLSLYAAIREMADLGMTPGPQSDQVLRMMATATLPDSVAVLQEDRLAYERATLLTGGAKPSACLERCRKLGVFERDFPEIHRAVADMDHGGQLSYWARVLEQVDEAWESASAEAGWQHEDRLELVGARLGYELARASMLATGTLTDWKAIVSPFVMPGASGEPLRVALASGYERLSSSE